MLKRKRYLKMLMSLLLVALVAPPVHAETLTVYAGESNSGFIPLYGAWADAYQKAEMVYNADVLTDMEGCQITSLTWYTDAVPSGNYGDAKFKIFIKEVTEPTINAYYGYTEEDVVYEGAIDPTSSDKIVPIVFTNPYTYNGGHLLIGVYEVVKGTYKSTTFVGTNVTNASISGYNSSSIDNVSVNQRGFLPKTTFEYESATPVPYKVKVSPESLAFGKLAVDDEKSLDITIKNQGENTITPSISGLEAPFSTAYTTAEIAKGETATITIKFNPTEAGDWTKNATLSFGTTELDDVTIAITGNAVLEKTVADGTSTNEYLPVYGYNHDSYNQQNQFVYPASDLTSLVGKKLKSITFYPAEVTSGGYYSTTYKGINFYNGSVSFSLASVDEGSISFTETDNTTQSPEGLTTVGTINMPSAAQPSLTEWTLTFDGEGFDYYGGDLLVDVTTLKGSYGHTYFYGITTDDYSGYYCESSTSKKGEKFLPKVTFTYEAAVPQVTVSPVDLIFGGENFAYGNTDTKTFKVTNTTAEAVSLTLNDETGFFSINPTTAIEAGTNATIEVTYAPTAADTHTATVTVGDKIVTLTGTAVAPVISGTVTPTELTFETYENIAATDVITVENTGNTAFTPEFSALEAPFSIEAAVEIAAGESKDFTVTYAPEKIGSHDGTLTVTINGTATVVVLSGSATEAPKEVTIAENGTAQSQPIPIEGTYLDTKGAYGQIIYNKNDLSTLAGKDITNVKFYSSNTFDDTKIGGTILEVYLMETDEDVMPRPSYTYQPLTFDGQAFGEYEVKGGDTEMEFILSTPFNYSGTKNLAVQVRVKTESPQAPGSNYQALNWYGETKTGQVISYAGNVGSSNSGGKTFLPKTTFTYDYPSMSLAELCESGKSGETYKINNENGLLGVYKSGNTVWFKDDNQFAEPDVYSSSDNNFEIEVAEGDKWHSKDATFDQSNWIEVEFPADAEGIAYENVYVKNLTGVFTNANGNPKLTVTKTDKITENGRGSYTPNRYCIANFKGTQDGHYVIDGSKIECTYFFVSPKPQEYAEIIFAVYNNGTLSMQENQNDVTGTINVDLTKNGSNFEPENGKVYTGFNVIVSKVVRSAMLKAEGDYVVYPVNLTDKTVPTAINTIGINGNVKSVKYVNVAGVVSDRPFEGVNIVVTEYTDGSRTTTKMVK